MLRREAIKTWERPRIGDAASLHSKAVGASIPTANGEKTVRVIGRHESPAAFPVSWD